MAIDKKYKDGYVGIRLKNVEVWWAHVHTPDTAFGNNKYCIEAHLTDALAKQLKAEGFSVGDKKKPDGTVVKNIFKAKTEVLNKKTGKPNNPPKIFGPDGSTFTDAIGNGSICDLVIDAKAWEVRGAWILSAYLKEVHVVKHVAYEGSSVATFDQEAF
jgi:hypothetical protein